MKLCCKRENIPRNILMMLCCWQAQGLLCVLLSGSGKLSRANCEFPKTKFMVVGSTVAAKERCPLVVGDGQNDWVRQSPR